MDLGEIGEVVYLFHAEGTDLFKIGRTADIQSRRRQLQTGCPHRLVLVGTLEGDARKTEGQLHRMFAQYRTTGEWFEVPEQWQVRRLFQDIETRDTKALEYILFAATRMYVSVYTCKFFDQHEKKSALRYQLMPSDDFHPFWTFYREQRHQYHLTAIQAAADWVDAYNSWPGRSDWLRSIGETYYVRGKLEGTDVDCPNCSWPISVTR